MKKFNTFTIIFIALTLISTAWAGSGRQGKNGKQGRRQQREKMIHKQLDLNKKQINKLLELKKKQRNQNHEKSQEMKELRHKLQTLMMENPMKEKKIKNIINKTIFTTLKNTTMNLKYIGYESILNLNLYIIITVDS